jgi:DNA-binding winged helix-turn-helix (wHTH) protein
MPERTKLTEFEIRLYNYLKDNPDKIIPYDKLIEKVWFPNYVTENSVRVALHFIRKFRPDINIVTVAKKGVVNKTKDSK